jgi:hypothetical protein
MNDDLHLALVHARIRQHVRQTNEFREQVITAVLAAACDNEIEETYAFRLAIGRILQELKAIKNKTRVPSRTLPSSR